MGAWLEAELSKTQEHREGLEPSSPHYESGVFAARSPVLVLQVGPEGLEPSPARLRAGDAAANTSVPSIESARWESNPRPASYKDAALTTELRASSASRAGGNRTHTCRIKSPVCCLLHHDPMCGRVYPFVATWQHG
jgi:hypothetical protein